MMDRRSFVCALAGALLTVAAGSRASTAFAFSGLDLTALITPYLAARERGAVGTVVGRAYAEAARPGDSPRPYAAVSVLLLPRSLDLERQLDAIKAGSRDSPDRLVDADPKVRAALTALERALLDAGGGMLLKGESTDGTGVFRLGDVPEGAWMLMGWQESGSMQKGSRSTKSDTLHFPTRPEVMGSSTVVYWLLSLDVKAGEETQVRLP
jgi:hypothetical protein